MFIEPQQIVGTWRRFGLVGPVYEVVGVGARIGEADHWMRVRLPDTGETVDYKLSDILDDPCEA